jgi:hypothetical protein
MPVAIPALIQGIIAGLPAAIQLGTEIANLIEKQRSGGLTQADADAALAAYDAAVSDWDGRPGPHA